MKSSFSRRGRGEALAAWEAQDGKVLQAGLAVAEALGGMRRPWTVANESGRIVLHPALPDGPARAAA